MDSEEDEKVRERQRNIVYRKTIKLSRGDYYYEPEYYISNANLFLENKWRKYPFTHPDEVDYVKYKG